MSDIAIKVEVLSKLYRIGSRQNDYRTLRDTITDAVTSPFRKFGKGSESASGFDTSPSANTIWALKDVSFEIKRGEVVGIIGRNGAGKSTLLKILSRITEPTEGRARIKGRVGSLLEVGTGFHPELTGRENIFLNGAILGMKKAEIKQKFDEIVAFAEVEKFIDTPVKHYSSGMYVRLAFAVAAHLEPEILLVDEVLAVGDVGFQKKCLGKMGTVAREGRTVIFVSHNMAAIKGLCSSGFLLENGQIVIKDTADAVVHSYLSQISATTEKKCNWVYRHRGSSIAIDDVNVLVNGCSSASVQSGDQCSIRIHYHTLVSEPVSSKLSVAIMLFSEGQKLVNLWTNYHHGKTIKILPAGVIECSISKWPFRSNLLRVDVFTQMGPHVQDWIEECVYFDSYDGDYYQSGIITRPGEGMLFLDHEWRSYEND